MSNWASIIVYINCFLFFCFSGESNVPSDSLIFLLCKAYYVLDELLIAGELQESSKKTVARLIAAQVCDGLSVLEIFWSAVSFSKCLGYKFVWYWLSGFIGGDCQGGSQFNK